MTVDRGPALGGLVDGGELRHLHADDVQILQRAVRLLSSSLSSRDGAVPANVAVLLSTLDRVVAAELTRGRFPSSEVLGMLGSAERVMSENVAVMEIDEVAGMLGCGPRNVRHLVRRGTLPAVKIGGRWTFARVDVLELLDSRRVA